MVQHVPVQKVVQKEACFGHGGMQARHEQEMLYGIMVWFKDTLQAYSFLVSAQKLHFSFSPG